MTDVNAFTYVRKLLILVDVQIRAVIPGARVGGGMTGPRAGAGGVSPVAWIKARAVLRARLDAYAHHPYPATTAVRDALEPRPY